jgi:hypothetical protein
LQCRHAFAFQVAFACPRQNRFGEETMLHPKSLFDGFSQEFTLDRCHGSNVTSCFLNRKFKKTSGTFPLA